MARRVRPDNGGVAAEDADNHAHKPHFKHKQRSILDDTKGLPPLALLQSPNYGSIRFPGSRMAPARWARLPVEEGKVRVRSFKFEKQGTMADVYNQPAPNQVVEDKTYAEVLMKLLTDTWGLKPPAAVISVLGPWNATAPDDENSLIRNPSLQPVVQRMLRSIATKIGAWVFTRGIYDKDGVRALSRCVRPSPSRLTRSPALPSPPAACNAMRRRAPRRRAHTSKRAPATQANIISLVGRAMEGSGVPCIGFAPWSQLAEQRALKQVQGNIYFSTPGKGGGGEGAGSHTLAPSHSHYLLIDDGTTNGAAATGVRTALRMFISNNDVSGDGIETPVLSIVLNGDLVTPADAIVAPADGLSCCEHRGGRHHPPTNLPPPTDHCPPTTFTAACR